MSIDFQLPNISAPTTEGQVAQIRGYLFQFVEKMKWALETLESSAANNGIILETGGSSGASEQKKISTFNELRDLIISNAEIVSAYAGAIKNLYDDSGYYVAHSEFGTYKEERRAILDVDEENGVILRMQKDAEIDEENDGEADQKRTYRGCLRIGNVTIGEEETKYGISIGQVTEVDDKYEFKSSARFTPTGLDFYDDKGERVAYIEVDEMDHTSKFFIRDAQITSSLNMGGYTIQNEPLYGLAFIWKG